MRDLLRKLMPAALVLLAACAEDRATGPGPDEAELHRQHGGRDITVLTRNMYVGANVDAVIAALASPDPSDDLPALQAAIQTLTITDFPTRVRALADEIAQVRPDLVGLQEVSTIDVDLTPLGLPVQIHQDFLAALQAELAARGLQYSVAGSVNNVQAAPLPGVSLLDRDVLLAAAGTIEVLPGGVGNSFQYNIGVVAPGVDIRRGYVAAPVRARGRDILVVTTHLESGSGPQLEQLRAAQAMELVAVTTGPLPVILLGDLNDVPGSAMHQILSGAGLVDAWQDRHPGARGFTCCQAADLLNASPAFDQRIDYVFTRGMERGPEGVSGRVWRIGDQRRDRVAGPYGLIWPSDHAGVVAELR